MSLRQRTLLVIGTALMLLVGGLYLAVSLFVTRGFERVEMDAARQDVQRVLDQVGEQLNKLSFTSDDWASWDDTYAYVSDRNEEYVTANLTEPSLMRLKLNLIAYLQPDGTPVFVRGSDPAFTGFQPPDASVQPYLAPGSYFWQPPIGECRAGIIPTPQALLMIAARPIATSAGEGPARGTLMFGRYLGAEIVQEISEKLHVTFQVHPLTGSLPAMLQAPATALQQAASAPTLVAPVDEQALFGFALLRDVQQRPVALVHVTLPRPVFQQAQRTRQIMLMGMLLVGLCLGAIALLLLERLVLARLSRLAADVRRLGPVATAARLSVQGQDELAQLALSLNQMLDLVGKAQQETAQLMAQQRAMLQALPDAMYRFSAQGLCLDVQGAAASRAPVVGRHLAEALSPEPALRDAFDRTRATHQMQVCEYTQERLGRGREALEARFVPGHGDEIYVLMRNVTDRARYAEALEREKKALEQLHALTQQEKGQLEDMNRLMVGREERMVQLKQEINTLLTELGRPPRY